MKRLLQDLDAGDIDRKLAPVPEARMHGANRLAKVEAKGTERDVDGLCAVKPILSVIGQAYKLPAVLVEDDRRRVTAQRG